MHGSQTNDAAQLQIAYRECHGIARAAAKNFYYAFLILPRDQRQAMCALYAFMRRTDDIGDGDETIERRRALLDDWRCQLADAVAGKPPRDIWWLALADTLRRNSIPPEYLRETVDAVASDLDVFRYASFDELYRYCYRVASVVGLACIRIWGATDPRADLHAEHCGIAFQLTNIVRDVVEDHSRGRIYFPVDELARFGLDENRLFDAETRSRLMELLRFQIDRAHKYYDRAEGLRDYLPPSGQAVFRVLVDIYRGLLRKIESRPEAVLEKRVRLHPARKMAALASALPKRFLTWPMPTFERLA